MSPIFPVIVSGCLAQLASLKGPWFQLICTFVEVEGVRHYDDVKFGVLVVMILPIREGMLPTGLPSLVYLVEILT